MDPGSVTEYEADEIDASAAADDDHPHVEKRLHLRAYRYWESLLDGREFPALVDLKPDGIGEFRDKSFLIDFVDSYDSPVLRFVGAAITEAMDAVDHQGRTIASVPVNSLLGRLTDHYMEVLANRAPIGFEAEYFDDDGREVRYRGILMPLSDDNETIHFIYGVMNWKMMSSDTTSDEPEATPDDAPDDTLAMLDADPIDVSAVEEALAAGAAMAAVDDAVGDDGAGDSDEDAAPADAGPMSLADTLADCRQMAHTLARVDSRSRETLYEALAKAFALFEAAERDPDGYAAVLVDTGIKRQARAPFTPVVKLMFGAAYDKTRITEYATALSYCWRNDQTASTVKRYIAAHEGGIKGCVQAERAERRAARGNAAVDQLEAAKDTLRAMTPVAAVAPTADTPQSEFLLLLGRRQSDGGEIDVLQVLDENKSVLEPILKRIARRLSAMDGTDD